MCLQVMMLHYLFNLRKSLRGSYPKIATYLADSVFAFEESVYVRLAKPRAEVLNCLHFKMQLYEK